MNERCYTIALIGNPNCGKSSLFNQLTGANQRTGNLSGVTVSGRSGECTHQGIRLKIIDLPGIYSLSQNRSEERVAREYLARERPDLVVNVLDATNLGRHLALTSQLLEQNLPLLLAVNMLDETERSGVRPDLDGISAALGVPVLPSDGRHKRYREQLLDAIVAALRQPSATAALKIEYEPHIEALLQRLERHGVPRWRGVRWLESGGDADFTLSAAQRAILEEGVSAIQSEHELSAAEWLSEGRYGWVHGLLHRVGLSHAERNPADDRLDRIVLNRWLGLPILIALLGLMFQTTFTAGALPAEWIAQGVEWLSAQVTQWLPPSLLREVLVDGVLAGVGGVLVFLPNVVLLFLFMELLEQSGYMARATFLVDQLLSRLGLHGKSLVPLVMGFGCNVPAIMATRSIEEPRARLITILINPFMSCSARLPVLLLLAGVFFPDHAGMVLFAVYGLGVLVALACAAVFARVLPAEHDETFVMELPPWRMPGWRSLLLHLWDRSRDFLRKVGTVILVGSILIWLLQTFPRGGEPLLLQLGHALTPLFAPLGFGWRETVALLSGFLAKEVIVATLAVAYHAGGDDTIQLQQAIGQSLPASAGLAFMVYTLLYMPCLATLAVIRRETGRWLWAGVSLLLGLSLAWLFAWLTFQIGQRWL
ncbi:MAG: ferrous iron transport protein B [Pseudomonadota bacterium]|jgi:ferrous iron transporter FeoB|nr:ferrous iron transport protein B [Pseudomonadota bacterium]